MITYKMMQWHHIEVDGDVIILYDIVRSNEIGRIEYTARSAAYPKDFLSELWSLQFTTNLSDKQKAIIDNGKCLATGNNPNDMFYQIPELLI